MNILIFNCGSSSQGFKLYEAEKNGGQKVLIQGKARHVATLTQSQAVIEWQVGDQKQSQNADLSSHAKAAREVIRIIKQSGMAVDGIGHRFVHGGERFKKTVQINADVLDQLKACFHLAPIHNPNSFAVIEVCLEMLPEAKQYAVFDTAFHAQLPEAARQYALPRELVDRYGYRKYGFHGLSYQFVTKRAGALLDKPASALKLIICHLGTGGSSVAAIQDGHSIETSMGYSPLPGLVMSTRCGDLDPEIVLDMMRNGYGVEDISRVLNNQSGLIGLSGFSSNLEEIISEAEKGNKACQTAFEVYVKRLQFYLGAYTWLLNRADAIIFTDDIGVKSWKLRQAVCHGAERLGVLLDEEANIKNIGALDGCISRPESATRVWVIHTDEEQVMLEEVLDVISRLN